MLLPDKKSCFLRPIGFNNKRKENKNSSIEKGKASNVN
jgi:hypothetical protein